MNYKEKQYQRQIELIETSDFFEGSRGMGIFRGKQRPFVLNEPLSNIKDEIRDKALKYFKENLIDWWGGKRPSGHTLSSQISCVNHLIPIMDDKNAVLSMINGLRNEFVDVLPVKCDINPQYIALEVVSYGSYLNEGRCIRGSNCTSIDALILAVNKLNQRILIPIEWKYTESYNNLDKSVEGKDKSKGYERQNRYNRLIDLSLQLKSMEIYEGSIYYQEPFYQLMRQTLLAEQIVIHKENEILQADDFLHIHVIPKNNRQLLGKIYNVSGKSMEETWRSCLNDNRKYVIIDPSDLFEPIRRSGKYNQLCDYLDKRYW